MAERPTLLMIRPQKDSDAFLSDLATALGWRPPALICPMLDIRPRPVSVPPGARAILFTSANAVPAAGAGDGRLALCVGESTAHVARTAGFRTCAAQGTVGSLSRLVRDRLRPQDGPLVHVTGAHVAGDLCGDLAAAGYDCRRLVGYEAAALPLSETARRLIRDEPVVLPVFSPRSAALAAQEVARLTPAALRWVAISTNAAAHLTGTVKIAPAPSRSGMIETIRPLL